jgi:hydrogenase-4 component F
VIALAVAAPFAGALCATLVPRLIIRRRMRGVLAVLAAALACTTFAELDRLSGLMVAIITVLSLVATLFSLTLVPASEHEEILWSSHSAYFVLLGAFWSSMLVAVTSTTFIGLWIGISATTLATTFLVGFAGGKAALEAAWKYLMLCSFGIAIALIGILFLGRAALDAHIASTNALSWDVLAAHGHALPPALVRIALVLMLLGFGTKAGLVPMHAWLPDAHSKAPAPISALLSGVLVSCALYAIVRVQHVADVTQPSFFNTVLLVLGSLSVLVAGTLMLAQTDVKRLFSYSTVEHAGLIAIALGLGTPLGLFAALYHLVNHAFGKSFAFFAVGIVQHEHGTTTIGKLRGLWNDRSGRLFLVALLGLMGFPPFGFFLSELLIVVAAAAAHQWLPLACALTGALAGFIALVRLAIESEAGSASTRVGGRRHPLPALVAAACTGAIALGLIVVPFVGGWPR